MKWILACVWIVLVLAGCTSGNDPEPSSLASGINQSDNQQHTQENNQKPEPDSPNVVYKTVFDIPFESMESDKIYTHRSKIAKLEAIDQDNPDLSIIAGMQLAYNLYLDDADANGIQGLGLAETDTRVFRYISDHEKQLVKLADLKEGQEIEVEYISPLTPVSLAIEITILSESQPEAVPKKVVNYDELLESARRLTSSTSVQYGEKELERMKNDVWRTNLEEVIQDFANKKLSLPITFMQSLPGTYNPTSVLIGNEMNSLYRIDLVKRYNLEGIWTVESYSAVNEGNKSQIDNPIDYRMIRKEEAEAQVNAWATTLMKNENGAEEVFTLPAANGAKDKTYVLLAAESGASVELLNVRAGDSSLSITYATASPNEQKVGRNPYILLEFDSFTIDVFIRKQSSIQLKDIRPNM